MPSGIVRGEPSPGMEKGRSSWTRTAGGSAVGRSTPLGMPSPSRPRLHRAGRSGTRPLRTPARALSRRGQRGIELHGGFPSRPSAAPAGTPAGSDLGREALIEPGESGVEGPVAEQREWYKGVLLHLWWTKEETPSRACSSRTVRGGLACFPSRSGSGIAEHGWFDVHAIWWKGDVLPQLL